MLDLTAKFAMTAATHIISAAKHEVNWFLGILEHEKVKNYLCKPVLPRIMNFGQIRKPNNIRIFKSDKYEFEYYSEI